MLSFVYFIENIILSQWEKLNAGTENCIYVNQWMLCYIKSFLKNWARPPKFLRKSSKSYRTETGILIPGSHFIWVGSGTDLVRSGNKAGFRSGLKLANVQPDLNPIKTGGSMQSWPDRACGSDSDLATWPNPDMATLSVSDLAPPSLPGVTNRSFSDLTIRSLSDLVRLSVSDRV